jgi:hypothetical protein
MAALQRNQTRVSTIKNTNSTKAKNDLLRPKVWDIIRADELFDSKDRCLLLSFPNDGEGRCVL